MAEQKQVYVSFENPNYKDNKAELLRCMAGLVSVQKSLHNLKAIRSTKRRLIAHLHELITNSHSVVSRVDHKMPDPAMPRGMKIKKTKKEILKENKEPKIKKVKISDSFDVAISNLDKELLALNKRIKELGG